jgi:hypothetical protein
MATGQSSAPDDDRASDPCQQHPNNNRLEKKTIIGGDVSIILIILSIPLALIPAYK